MNYYEHHIGDFDSATAHLTMLEDAAYRRLISLYYRTERPIPADVKHACRLVRAHSKQERDAVAVVLDEFFDLRDDGWHNLRCDAEISKFRAGEPEREAKKANEANRLKRHRDERAVLFKRITDAGLHAPWNIGIAELREMAKRLPGTNAQPFPATAPATPATATQAPDTTTHTPDSSMERREFSTGVAPARVEPPAKDDIEPSVALAITARRLGVDCHGSDPRLIALAEQGVEPDSLAAACEKARADKPGERIGIGLVIAILEQWAAKARRIDARGASPPKSSAHATFLALTGRSAKQREVIDVDAHAAAIRLG